MVGSGFLITHYKNPAGTGKAVSKEFTIDKPFLTFRIGGGHYPNQACLNLVVDGKIVRTETGNDTNELRPAYWDVYPLIGKTAHLEVVDSIANPNLGYIIVDNIAFDDGRALDLFKDPTNYTKTPDIASYRFYSQSVFANKSIARAFGTNDKTLDSIEYAVWQRCLAEDMQHRPGESLDALAHRLRNATRIVKGIEDNPRLFQYALAYMIAAWVKSHMGYVDMGEGISQTGKDVQGNTVVFEQRHKWISLPELMKCN